LAQVFHKPIILEKEKGFLPEIQAIFDFWLSNLSQAMDFMVFLRQRFFLAFIRATGFTETLR
jgi:hypothetical protein